MAQECIFCRVVAGELPSDRVYQDEAVVAFRDIHPVAPVHVLVVPRRHVSNLGELEEGDAELMAGLLRVAARLGRSLAPAGYRVVINVGEEGGQTVGHLHLHVLGGRTLGVLCSPG